MSIIKDLLLDFLEAEDSFSSGSVTKKEKYYPDITYGIGICLYFLFFIVTIVNYIYKRKKARKKLPSMATRFFICLPLFMISRIVFFIIKIVLDQQSKNGNKDYALDSFNGVLNRVTMCIFIFVFNTLLFYWIDTIHTTVNAAFAQEAFGGSTNISFVTPASQIATYVVTAVVVIIILVLSIIYEAMDYGLETSNSEYTSAVANDVHAAGNIIISIMFLIFGLCFFFYGTKLNCRIVKQSDKKVEGLWKTELFSIGLCVCFILRFIFFSYVDFYHARIQDDLFVVLNYFLVELIPVVLILWSINGKMFNSNDDKEKLRVFIDPLLAEEEEDESRETEFVEV